ncbi:Type I inositol-1,4,5-trisphosphate 5-phosphatase, putative [Pediculus humanus corporis]|uniref:inositol-polyphosphate 5-phosphatase n=1 Tax=Pediculus humanus subsp. corporis TaxID=121224 RepID=E0VUX5_PEDHC|nr:Type I inositol-1,4,5-trisphosphate 5-phosphatase, putative [Pediculus humanus corporis]EEB17181.1 Type I inositol-1,4,5-trisphosphate 5-phosphatase, putative [Pediculus humanus corporis]
MMSVRTTPVVYITANVGSIFEEPTTMLKIWTEEFLSTVARLDPKFVALHCQEVGGKNYEKSMQYVENFVKLLINSEELRLFDKARIYLDEDYSSAENFTALGNFYFIHESITDVLIFDFEERRFKDVNGISIFSKNIEHEGTKEKSKFPLEYFPECKWSRKGFLRTRWCLNGTVFDLVNIHLFHDVSNFVAIKSFPSVYSDTRRRALAYTLERFQTDEYGPVPLFVFGDFNFRADTQGVVKHLSEGLKSSCLDEDVNTIEFKQEDKVIFSLGKKEFNHSDHQSLFTVKDGDWLREYDKELNAFSDHLFEFKISFPPSYPFEENSSGDRCYMKTRCPAWCDRVVMSHSAIPLVKDSNDSSNVIYSIMGRNTCMGDHKVSFLN